MLCKNCKKVDIVFLLDARGKRIEVETSSLNEIELSKVQKNEKITFTSDHKKHDCGLKRGYYFLNGVHVWID